jgi:hypothetical protein
MIKSLPIAGLALAAVAALPLMSTPITSTNSTAETQRPRRLGSIAQAANEQSRSERTLRNYLAKGYFPAYRMRGVHGVLLDLDEVDAAISKLPKRLSKAGFGSYGPKAVILDIPPQVIISDARLGSVR